MADLAGMKQCSSSSLLHHAFEDSVVPGVGRVGDMKVIASTQWTRIHAREKNNKIFICNLNSFSIGKSGF